MQNNSLTVNLSFSLQKIPCETPRRHSDRSPGLQGWGAVEESRLGLTHKKPLVLR